MPNDQWRVVNNDSGRAGRRTHLAGSEDDARNHVVNNFPRQHVEPFGEPAPDVFVVAPDGTLHSWNGEEWTDHSQSDDDVETEADLTGDASDENPDDSLDVTPSNTEREGVRP